MSSLTRRPPDEEHAPYYTRYVALVPEGDLIALLADQIRETSAVLRAAPPDRHDFAYAPDKWTVKDVVAHMADTERIFAYRALRIARGDKTPIPGFEQDDYVRNAAFDDYPLADLAAEFEHVRRANILLFGHLSGEAWLRRGRANDSEVSVRALAYIIAGHAAHHARVLSERYAGAGG